MTISLNITRSNFSLVDWSKIRSLWDHVWTPSEMLRNKPLGQRVLVRLTKAVATVAYFYGVSKATGKFITKPRSLKQADAQYKTPLLKDPCSFSNVPNKTCVVIPCLATDEEDIRKLGKTLVSFRLQTLKPTYVLVVDDGSPVPLVDQLPKSDQDGITFLRHTTNQGPAAARNTGLQAARDVGMEYVCFTDADCLPTPLWIESITRHFADNPSDDIIGGITKSLRQESFIETFHDAFGTLNGPTLPDKTLLYGPTCNMGVRLRTVDLKFNTNFPEAAFEDVAFCVEARKVGVTLHLAPKAVVLHDYRLSLLGVARQFARYGRGAATMNHIHPYFSSWHANSRITPCSKVKLPL